MTSVISAIEAGTGVGLAVAWFHFRQSSEASAAYSRAQALLAWHRRAERTAQPRHREVPAMRQGRGRVNRSPFEKVESR